MSSVHSERPAVHRTLPKGRVYGVYALDWTQVYEVDGKVYAECTPDVRRDDSLKTSSENLSLVPCFVLGTGERALRSPWMDDLRFLNPWVGCKPLMCNALQVAATAMLPLLGPVLMSSGAVQWAA